MQISLPVSISLARTGILHLPVPLHQSALVGDEKPCSNQLRLHS